MTDDRRERGNFGGIAGIDRRRDLSFCLCTTGVHYTLFFCLSFIFIFLVLCIDYLFLLFSFTSLQYQVRFTSWFERV